MSTMLSNLDLLRRVPLFSLLTVAQAEVISGAVIKRRFKRGEALVEQGQNPMPCSFCSQGAPA